MNRPLIHKLAPDECTITEASEKGPSGQTNTASSEDHNLSEKHSESQTSHTKFSRSKNLDGNEERDSELAAQSELDQEAGVLQPGCIQCPMTRTLGERVDARPNDECSPAVLSHSPPLDHEDGVPQSACTITQPNAKDDKQCSTQVNRYGLEALTQLEDDSPIITSNAEVSQPSLVVQVGHDGGKDVLSQTCWLKQPPKREQLDLPCKRFPLYLRFVVQPRHLRFRRTSKPTTSRLRMQPWVINTTAVDLQVTTAVVTIKGCRLKVRLRQTPC